MKLKNLLEAVCLNKNLDLTIDIIKGNDLENIKQELLKLEEFKNVKQINILQNPFSINDNTGPEVTQCYKLGDNTDFNEVVDLYSLSLSPQVVTSLSYNPTREVIVRMSSRSIKQKEITD